MRITLHNKSRYAKRAAVSRHLSAIQAGIVTGDTDAAPHHARHIASSVMPQTETSTNE